MLDVLQPNPQEKNRLVTTEAIKLRAREWTERGKSWLSNIKKKTIENPKEAIEEIAKVSSEDGLDRDSIDYSPELTRSADEFMAIGVGEGIKKYMQEYGVSKVIGMLELAKANIPVFNRIVELGLPPQYADSVYRFEYFRVQPKKEGYDFTTHAFRLEHYLKMVDEAEQRGPEVGFQLRSRAENINADIDAVAYSMGGDYSIDVNAVTGKQEERGLPYTSFNRGTVATGYGDLAWVGLHDNLMRNSEAGLSYRVRAGTGEINVYTENGKLIKLLRTIDKYRGNPSEEDLVAEAINTYKEMKGNLDLDGNIEEIRELIAGDIARAPVLGIELFDPFVVCLVPAEQAMVVKERIDRANLSEQVRSLLKAQLVEYDGDGRNIFESFANLVQKPQAYAERVSQASQFTDHPLTVQQAIEEINLRDTMGRNTLVTDKHRFTRVSDLPLPGDTVNGVNGYLELALRDRLQIMPEWSFLSQLPKEADGLLLPVFDKVMIFAMETVGPNFDTEIGREKITEILKDIANDSTKPMGEMDIDRSEQVSRLFGLDHNSLDKSQSVFNQWYKKRFVFV